MNTDEYMHGLWNGPNRPHWAKPYRPYATETVVVVTRYSKRRQSRTTVNHDSEYARYLLSPHWQKFRLAVMVFSLGQCARCKDVADHVHHLHYQTKGRERLCDVEPLCVKCHDDEHRFQFKVIR